LLPWRYLSAEKDVASYLGTVGFLLSKAGVGKVKVLRALRVLRVHEQVPRAP
jgi:hypothetical protein